MKDLRPLIKELKKIEEDYPNNFCLDKIDFYEELCNKIENAIEDYNNAVKECC